jgi:uncharacterized surface anchored protein
MNERELMRGKIGKRLLPLMMAAALLVTSMPTDVWADQTGDETVSQNQSPVQEASEDEPSSDNTTRTKARARSAAARSTTADSTDATDIFDGTSITLTSLLLEASYEDGENVVQNVTLTENGNFELPYDADINMRLEFILGTADSIEEGRTYIYQIPSSIRVDEETTHELSDGEGRSIGTVHIAHDGTLSFLFDKTAIGTSQNTKFYVQFEGGLSEELQEAGKQAEISFPTQTGGYDITINTTDRTGETEDTEPGDVGISKYGTRIINENGQNYIEWTVELAPNGRESLSGEIIDNLPKGLTYAAVVGYPKLDNTYGGTVESSTEDGDSQVCLTISDCKTYYHTYVKFCTYYDAAVFTSINNNTSQLIDNTVVFNPDDNTTGVTADGTTRIQPNMLEKSGTKIDDEGNIEWTVTLNKENLNLQGATYTDTFGTGLKLAENTDIKIEPELSNGAVLTQTDTGFTIDFAKSDTQTYTITYTTAVTDGYDQSAYQNTAKLTGGKDVTYDLSKNATVPGLNILKKNYKGFNSVTNTFTWEIVVNEDERELTNVTVTDTFPTKISGNAGAMTFVSVDGATLDSSSNPEQGKLVFSFDKLTEKKVITVTTQVKDEIDLQEGYWYLYKNSAEMKCSELNNPVSAEASTWQAVEKPDLIGKDGKICDDGTIEWTVTVYEPQVTVEGITFEDVLPENMEYVDGTFRIQNRYYDSSPLYRTPRVTTDKGVQTLTYKLDSKNDDEKAFFDKAFEIVYKTKVKSQGSVKATLDYTNASHSYTNNATVTVDYEGNITVEDNATKTVEGVVGGVIDKTASYRTGLDYVDWTVTINAAHNDMSSIANPRITDQLADYFDYESSSLWKVAADGTETEVDSSEYQVLVVNRNMTVILPNIGKDCYKFKFRTYFNCFSSKLTSETITNTANFEGDGLLYSKESNSVKNVSFSSSSAGAVVKREIRVKKVDADTGDPLAGAKFSLYYDDICLGEAVSGEDGYAVFEDLNSMTGYELVLWETQAPDGYQISGDDENNRGKTTITDYVEAKLKADTNGVRYYEVRIDNKSIESTLTGDIVIRKVAEDGTLLSGAVFGLYQDVQCTQAVPGVGTRTTVNGSASFQKLEQGTYYLKELSSPEGYLVSDKVIKVEIALNAGAIEVKYDGQTQDMVTVTDEKATGTLKITKREKAENQTGQLLADAKFSIYRDALCTDRVDSQTTDANGVATFTNLELGRIYYYREVEAPSGYLLDSTVHSVTIGTGTETTVQTKSVTAEDEEALGNIVITKVDNSTKPQTLSGVTFTLYYYNADGTSDTPYQVNGTNYTVTTADNGVAVFENIPFGNYIIKETTGKAGYELAADTAVTVDALGDKNVTIVNNIKTRDIKLTKYEKDTNTVLAGAEIGLYTDKGVRIATAVTDEKGEVCFKDIPYGNYELRELKAPEGYKLATDTKSVTTSDFDGNLTGTLTYQLENEKEKGSIQIKKTDDEATPNPLGGAEFTLYDANMLALETEATDDTYGIVRFEELAYGTYYVRETKAPDGYVRSTETYKVVVNSDTTVDTYVDDKGNSQSLTLQNVQATSPFISFKLKKVDDNEQPLANAVFGLYKNEVTDDGQIATAVTDENGIAYFKRIHVEEDEKNTKYLVKEIAAPAGYRIDNTVITLATDITERNRYGDPQTDGALNLTEEEILWIGGRTENDGTATFKNTAYKGSIQITKTGINASQLLQGAEFTLYQEDKDGNKVKVALSDVTNPVTTDSKGVALFTNLPVGVYYVKETKAPAGYTLNTTENKVVIVDDAVMKLTYQDTPISVSISKRTVGSNTELPGAVFTITDITDPNKQVEVDSWTSTTSAHKVKSGVLEVGHTYELKETAAPSGYGLMENPVEFTINQDGSITTTAERNGQTIIIRDEPVTLTICKLDENRNQLPGAILAIYDDKENEILRFTSGTMPYQTLVGLLKTNPNGWQYYTLRELSAPDGYEKAEDIKFGVYYTGEIYTVWYGGKTVTKLKDGKLEMTDNPKTSSDMYIRKLDAESGLDVAGATFSIYKADDLENPITTWTSDGTPHKLDKNDFTGGTTYVLRETSAPQGYLTANAIKFHIDTSTSELVIDEGSADNLNADKDTLLVRDQQLSLKIRKQDGYGQQLKGATLKLSVYDTAKKKAGKEILTYQTDSSEYTVQSTLLNVNTTYILQELAAPDGYMKADDIIFTIDEKGRITREDGITVYQQTIVMEDEEAGLGIGKISLETSVGLAGSKLLLTTTNDPYFVTQTWVSDGQVKTWNISQFTPGSTYVLTEVEAPDGYAYADPITFTVEEDHQVYINGEAVDNKTVKIADGKLTLTVSKQDLYDKTEIAGAKLAILDENGQVVTSWTSGNSAWSVDTSKLIAGKDDTYQEYVLTELEAPEGYHKADDIRFAIDKYGQIYLVSENADQTKKYTLVKDNHLFMYDDPVINIRKLDTQGNMVVGAKLSITAKDDADFESITWVTDDKPYYIADGVLKAGVTYILTELEAPAGYAYTQSIEFSIDDKGNLTVAGADVENKRIVMLDYPMTVYINKVEAGSGKGIADALLVIKNEAGEVLYHFTSTGEPVLLPADIYTAVKQGEMQYFTLSELEAPAGYDKAEDIDFAVDSDGNLYLKDEAGTYQLYEKDTIEMKDSKRAGSTAGGTGTVNPNFKGPKTGDETPVGWLVTCCAAGFVGACGMFGAYFIRRRKVRAEK